MMKVRDALKKLDDYLGDAAIAGMPRVRVIHGKGTGILKNAVLEFLAKHPLVARTYAAAPSEGNGGVTIAELK
jgi:DNA mismatch repair protein MutS2